MNKELFRDGVGLIFDVAETLEMSSAFGREDTTVRMLRDGLARLLYATRHEGIYPRPETYVDYDGRTKSTERE